MAKVFWPSPIVGAVADQDQQRPAPRGYRWEQDPLAPVTQGGQPARMLVPERRPSPAKLPKRSGFNFDAAREGASDFWRYVASPFNGDGKGGAGAALADVGQAVGTGVSQWGVTAAEDPVLAANQAVETFSPMTSFSEGYQGVGNAGAAAMRGDWKRAGQEALRGLSGYAGTALGFIPGGKAASVTRPPKIAAEAPVTYRTPQSIAADAALDVSQPRPRAVNQNTDTKRLLSEARNFRPNQLTPETARDWVVVLDGATTAPEIADILGLRISGLERNDQVGLRLRRQVIDVHQEALKQARVVANSVNEGVLPFQRLGLSGSTSDLRNALTGGAVGAFGGSAADPEASPAERLRNALLAAIGGAGAGYVAGRASARLPKTEAQVMAAQDTFAGINAKTADRVKLARAQEMDAAGADRRAIWDATGWFKGADGKWRFEIDDRNLKPKTSAMMRSKGRLDDFVSDADAGGAYPDLAAMPAKRGIEMDSAGYEPPGYSASGEGLQFGARGGTAREQILHERQHAIQNREGFASGGNPSHTPYFFNDPADQAKWQALRDEKEAIENAIDMKDLRVREWRGKRDLSRYAEYPDIVERLKRDARISPNEAPYLARYNEIEAEMEALRKKAPSGIETYRRLAGEVEARNVQARRNMTPEERRAKAPWTTQDVPDERQFVRFGQSGPQMSVPTTGNALTRAPKPARDRKPDPRELPRR